MRFLVVHESEHFSVANSLATALSGNSSGDVLVIDLEELIPRNMKGVAESKVVVFVVSNLLADFQLPEETQRDLVAALNRVEGDGGVVFSLRLNHAKLPVFLEGSLVIEYYWRQGDQIILPRSMQEIADEIVGYTNLDPSIPPQAEMGSENLATDQVRVVFDSGIEEEQVISALTVLANYFRMCGGAGLTLELEPQQAHVRDVVYE